MKDKKPAPSPDDIELYPDAMERLERAIKIAARHPPIKRPTAGKSAKPKKPRAIREREPHLTRRMVFGSEPPTVADEMRETTVSQ